jgi:hypothetical protein
MVQSIYRLQFSVLKVSGYFLAVSRIVTRTTMRSMDYVGEVGIVNYRCHLLGLQRSRSGFHYRTIVPSLVALSIQYLSSAYKNLEVQGGETGRMWRHTYWHRF